MYRRKDAYYRRAKAAGYRSRSAYKLLELNRRFELMRKGDRVLDLGCWPGGWLQAAADAVGGGGRVVGVDLVEVQELPQPFVTVVVGDIANENVRARVAEKLGGLADVVLSDMAPKLTGVRDRDEERAAELVALAVGIARELLRPGGRMAVKLFTNAAAERLVVDLRSSFKEVRRTRPDATRKGSAEFYAIALGFLSQG